MGFDSKKLFVTKLDIFPIIDFKKQTNKDLVKNSYLFNSQLNKELFVIIKNNACLDDFKNLPHR